MHRLRAFSLVLFFYPSITFIASVLSDEMSFNFQAFDGRIVPEGDASLSPSRVQLTVSDRNRNLNSSAGRATYHAPMHLWDKSSGNVADFTTQFSFVIDSEHNWTHADGLTFFLAPNGSDIPSNSSGGNLALVSANRDPSDPSTAFVAVEFDTFYDRSTNFWDPPCTHVGIDLNNISSAKYTCVDWFGQKIMVGGLINASISYNSSTQNLSVLMIDATHPNLNIAKLSHSVNLTKYLPEWVTIGFSATTGLSFELHTLYSWEFSSYIVTEDANRTSNPVPADKNTNDKFRAKGSKSWLWPVTGLGSFLLLTLVLGFAWFDHRSKRKINDRIGKEDDVLSIEEEFDQVTGPKKFSYRELVAATDNFAAARLLGKGGFGRVYEGCLIGTSSNVAIKKITPESRQGRKEYATEVKTISRLRHRNLVQLIGWCHEKKELLLIYEFMPNGSLDSHLFKHRTILTWERRYRIAQGIVSALLYLHEEWEQCVVHRDVKTSNIMLDLDFNAKLGDFGLARLVDHAKGSQTTVLAGTMGYMAPESIYMGKASKESDVYSLGIVLLEIACGRRVVDSWAIEGQVRLVDWVWELYGVGKQLDAVDPKLCGDFDVKQLERLIIVGLWCAHPDSRVRPSIREALNLLNFDGSPPALPSTLPVPTYLAPPPSILSTWLLLQSSGTSTGGEPVGNSIEMSICAALSKESSCSSSSALISNGE
ncbi:Protein kinase domain-containing protein [Psidium guajava]|nr:Protein kinase domain-containing protein [Psidium guajava]